jgi:hypothetical protein
LSYPFATLDHVFESFGVALAVRPLGADWTGLEPGEGGAPTRPARLSEVLPVAGRSSAENAAELVRVQQLKAALGAYEMDLILAVAADRPACADRQPGQPGAGTDHGVLPEVSEFFLAELAQVFNCSQRAAEQVAVEAYTLRERLPAVWEALADGELDLRRARVFADVLGHTPAEVVEPILVAVLPVATRLTTGRLRAALINAVLAVDAAAAEQQRARAELGADVRMTPTESGMSKLIIDLPTPVTAACWATANELAWMLKHDGDDRPIGLLRAMCAADLLLRPWDTTRPGVTATLDVVVPLPSLTPPPVTTAETAERPATADATSPPERPGEPVRPTPARAELLGEVNGQPITAAHLRELLTQLDAVCPGGLQAPPGGELGISITDVDGVLLATTTRPELARLVKRGCPDHPTSGRGETPDCGCPVLTAPPPIDRYTPTPAQKRFTRARDRTCRFPGCGQPAARADLDHCLPYDSGGHTGCDNLCCLCRFHHRLKTLAKDWRFELTDNGTLRVTTPSGITRTTRPPGLRDLTELPALPAPPSRPPPPWDEPPF